VLLDEAGVAVADDPPDAAGVDDVVPPLPVTLDRVPVADPAADEAPPVALPDIVPFPVRAPDIVALPVPPPEVDGVTVTGFAVVAVVVGNLTAP
jgi:hypothetical protein